MLMYTQAGKIPHNYKLQSGNLNRRISTPLLGNIYRKAFVIISSDLGHQLALCTMAAAVNRIPIFAFKARVVSGVICRCNAGQVERIGIVFIMADSWGHGPARRLLPGGHCSRG